VGWEHRFSRYLKEKGFKHTRQRELVLKAIAKAGPHPAAEDIYAAAGELDANLGQATVYRTLKLLVNAGIVQSLAFNQEGPIRYELAAGIRHHDHLICRLCGEIIEVCDDAIELLQKRLAESHGYAFEEHRMYLYGICPACQAKNAAAGIGGDDGDGAGI